MDANCFFTKAFRRVMHKAGKRGCSSLTNLLRYSAQQFGRS